MSTIERNNRKTLEGWIVKDKNEKTRVVEIRWQKPDPLYKKVLHRSIKVHAHDEKNESKRGDRVRVTETRPFSKLKRWRVTEILQKA